MKKHFLLYIIFLGLAICAKADHITGGEIFYSLKSVSGNQYTYSFTVKMYMDCASNRVFNDPIIVSFFDKLTYARVKDVTVNLADTGFIQLSDDDPCISNPQQVCYKTGNYHFDVTLPASVNGYTVSAEVFFRVNNLANFVSYYYNVGATYTAEIPGTSVLASGPNNNSATFDANNLAIVCNDNFFQYSFSAKDKDGDQLRYSLCNAYQTVSNSFGNTLKAPDPPPYPAVPYSEAYDGQRPLGINVTINSTTGMVSGIAPEPGTYAIAVCVEELRNGVVIATQRKDLQINVTECSKATATIPEQFLLCDTSKTIELVNQSTSPDIESYYWQINNQKGDLVFSSTEPLVDYTFADTGEYKIQLRIGVSNQCADTAFSIAKVYPGFAPAFSVEGICLNKQSHFLDGTVSPYGIVNSWLWDFDTGNNTDTSSALQNPFYTYPTEGSRIVQLIVGNSKGCKDTITKSVTIYEKPPVQLAFRDTLICTPDQLQLRAEGGGQFVWTPLLNITNPNSSTPTVSPKSTTTYYVDMDQDGCINRDSVLVRVVDHVTLSVMNDTSICLGDTVMLNVNSDALTYTWSPATTLNDPTLQNPSASPTDKNVVYTVNAFIGSCKATGKISISTAPKPYAVASNDTTICYGSTIQLEVNTDGDRYSWSPANSLDNANSLHPFATPVSTTAYLFTSFKTQGCLKPATDTVKVVVLPRIPASAGRDTSIVLNQPLQLNGSGGTIYHWSPSTDLSAVDIPNPVATYAVANEGIKYRLDVSDNNGCTDSAFVTVKIFKTLPSVFVPSGFSPNGDGKNDVLRPILVGIKQVQIFNVYNRFGQLLFSTSENGKGWDGTYSGVPQQTGTYVWMIKAIDYNGKPYFGKGTVTIIR